MVGKKAHIISELQSDILRLQGLKPASNAVLDSGLGPIKSAFPNGTFPLGSVHEFLIGGPEDSAATQGFMGGLLASFMGTSGVSLWISSSRQLFPPALKHFGVDPDRFLFIDVQKEKDVLWAVDEALKCAALTAVVGEVQALSFTASRRLQLAVEQSQVTGFILRNNFRSLNTTACVSRWKISSLPSESPDNLPGIGFPSWRVELLRIRNGKPGVWNIHWRSGRFNATPETVVRHPDGILQQKQIKAG